MADTNTTEDKTTSKMSSRKFIVWLATTIICVAVLVLCFFRNMDSEVIIKDLELYTVISGVYLGANVGSKFANILSNKTEGESTE